MKANGVIPSVVLLITALLCGAAAGASYTNLITIDFEPSEGYTNGRSLSGQSHWFLNDINGSGIVSYLPGLGQQAFLGINPLTPPNTYLEAAFPLVFTPTNYSYLTFSAVLYITASTQGGADDFFWLFLSPDDVDLLDVDFLNAGNLVAYETNNGNNIMVGGTFANESLYRLEIDMDFVRNAWTASLGADPITPSPQPIGIPGHPVALSGIVGYWLYQDADSPGNNAMYFDHVRVVAGTEPPTLPAPQLKLVSKRESSGVSVSVTTEPGLNYVLETSSNLVQWTASSTNYATNLLWAIDDSIPPGRRCRFYRAYAIAP